LFFCGRARKRKSGFSVPTAGGFKINRVGGDWGNVGATKQGVSCWLVTCSELQPRAVPNNSYPTRTRFILEATVNRLEEMGPTNMVFVGGAHFCKLVSISFF